MVYKFFKNLSPLKKGILIASLYYFTFVILFLILSFWEESQFLKEKAVRKDIMYIYNEFIYSRGLLLFFAFVSIYVFLKNLFMGIIFNSKYDKGLLIVHLIVFVLLFMVIH
jgi:hypothetical protein